MIVLTMENFNKYNWLGHKQFTIPYAMYSPCIDDRLGLQPKYFIGAYPRHKPAQRSCKHVVVDVSMCLHNAHIYTGLRLR